MAGSTNQTDILAKLAPMNKLFDNAKRSSNPFAPSKLPVDLYVFHLTKGSITLSGAAGKEKVPTVTLKLVCMGAIGDKTLDKKTGRADTQWYGEQYNVRHVLAATENQGLEEKIERMIFDLQDIGFLTRQMILTGKPQWISEATDEDPNAGYMQFTLAEALAMLSNPNNVTYVRGQITESVTKKGTFKNLNLRGSVSNEEMEGYFGPGGYTPIPDDVPADDGGGDQVFAGEEEVPPDEVGGEYVAGEGAEAPEGEYAPYEPPVEEPVAQQPVQQRTAPQQSRPTSPPANGQQRQQVGQGAPRPANAGMRPVQQQRR